MTQSISTIMKFVMVSILFAFLSSCSGYIPVKGPSVPTVASGTTVAYSKVMNPAYAKDYIGADIITEVSFYAPNASNMWQTKVPKDHIVFQVTPIGGSAKTSPLGNEQIGDYVFVQKDKGAMVFDLEQGSRIRLRGGTRVRKGLISRDLEIIEFVATSIEKI